jgi:hypothetical protein
LWGAKVTLDQKKSGIGQPRNLKNCGQGEAYFGSPQSEIDFSNSDFEGENWFSIEPVGNLQ